MNNHFNRVSSLVLLGMVCLFAAGCAGRQVHNDVQDFVIEPRPVTMPIPYTVAPPDSIEIKSPQASELNGGHTIAPDGTITLELIGRIYVAGLTAPDIAELLRTKSLKFYTQVDVLVRVSSFASKRYYIFGEVAGEGLRRYTGTETILDVLASARPTRDAMKNRIYIMRPSPDGRSVRAMTVDFEKWRTTGILSRNALVAPGDIIYVPPTDFVLTARTIDHFLQPLGPIVRLMTVPPNTWSRVTTPWDNQIESRGGVFEDEE